MPTPETARLELYNGLNDVLGMELTDKLMAYLPTDHVSRLATKDDLFELETRLETRLGARIDEVEARVGARIDELDSRLSGRIDGLGGRIDGLDARIGRVEDSIVASTGASTPCSKPWSPASSPSSPR